MQLVTLFGALVAREITMTLHYRWWLTMMQVSNLIGPAVSLLVWRGAIAFGAQPPVSGSFLTTYLVLVSVVGLLTSSWTANFLAVSIRMGTVSLWLVRPCSTHLAHLANNVGEKLVKLVVMLPLALALGVIFREELRLPTDGFRWLLFVLSILLATGISFSLDVLIGSMAFWLEDISAVDRARNVFARTLSGALVPLALFPHGLMSFLEVQPFRYVLSFPLEVLIGDPMGGLVNGFVIQAAWFSAFLTGAAVVWRVGLRRYQGAGE